MSNFVYSGLYQHRQDGAYKSEFIHSEYWSLVLFPFQVGSLGMRLGWSLAHYCDLDGCAEKLALVDRAWRDGRRVGGRWSCVISWCTLWAWLELIV